MKSPNIYLKLSVLIGTAAMLVLINASIPRPKAEVELHYENWLKQNARQLSSDTKEPSSIKLQLVSFKPGNEWIWELQGGDQPEQRARLLRLLRLIAESNLTKKELFETKEREISHLSLSVIDDQERFRFVIDTKDLESDLPLRNLLKLFEVYAAPGLEPKAVAVAPNRGELNEGS